MTIKRKIQTKYKLPPLNWVVLKPNQVRGTVFNELDDDKIIDKLDFGEFEEFFKVGVNPGAVRSETLTNGDASHSELGMTPSRSANAGLKRGGEQQTLLEHKRLRNLAISKRKLAMDIPDIIRAVNALDLNAIGQENVEILLRFIPTPEEMKAYKEYEAAKKPVDALSDEDRLMMQVDFQFF